MKACVFGLNVNSLLLAVIVLESVFLGWFFLGIIVAPPGYLPSPNNVNTSNVSRLLVYRPQANQTSELEILRPPDEIEAHEVTTGFLVGSVVLFILQFLGLVCLVLGYKHQAHGPLVVFLAWLVLSNIGYVTILVLAMVNARSYADDYVTQYKTQWDILNGTMSSKDLPDLVPPKPLVIILRNTVAHINVCIIPMFFVKILLFAFEVVASGISIRFFKRLQANAESNREHCERLVVE